MELITISFRALFFYIVIYIFYRMMGKREIGELKVIDLAVSMLLIDIVSLGIENSSKSIFLSLVPVLLLVLLQIVVAKITLKNEKVRKIVDGEPSVIINRGKVNFKEMLEQRYNLDDLLMELRSQGVKSIEEVDYAVLEISGRLSIFLKDNEMTYPLPVILDGKIDEDVLLQIGKSREWLENVLEEEKYELKNVFYGFYRNEEMFLIRNDIK